MFTHSNPTRCYREVSVDALVSGKRFREDRKQRFHVFTDSHGLSGFSGRSCTEKYTMRIIMILAISYKLFHWIKS